MVPIRVFAGQQGETRKVEVGLIEQAKLGNQRRFDPGEGDVIGSRLARPGEQLPQRLTCGIGSNTMFAKYATWVLASQNAIPGREIARRDPARLDDFRPADCAAIPKLPCTDDRRGQGCHDRGHEQATVANAPRPSGAGKKASAAPINRTVRGSRKKRGV
jgi:hypothetical protein